MIFPRATKFHHPAGMKQIDFCILAVSYARTHVGLAHFLAFFVNLWRDFAAGDIATFNTNKL